MKKIYPIPFFLLLLALGAQGQEDHGNGLDFSLLRQNDIISLTEEEKIGMYKNLKEITLGDGNTLSFGGSVRFQTEAFVNEEFSSEEDQDDIWFLNRFLFHTHLKVKDQWEVFAELNASFINSKENLAPVDRDELSVNQFFVTYHVTNHWNVLVGRQNMRLGSGRLIDVREGPNVRQSFDMAQLRYQDDKTTVTGFHAVPVRIGQGIFDNEALDFQESVSALYWTQQWTPKASTDIYGIYKQEEDKTWDSGTADDERLSLGLRHFGTWNKLTYNNEFVAQVGRFGTQDIWAWTASFNLEHPAPFLGKHATIGIKTEAISGDSDSNDNSLNTFDGLYPRGAYFGRVARIGPSNLFDIHPYVDLGIGPLALELDYVAFWRFSREDGVYGPPLNLQYPSVNDQRFIGHQIGTIAALEWSPFITLELETNIIIPGAFLVDSGLDDSLFHAVFTAEFKF